MSTNPIQALLDQAGGAAMEQSWDAFLTTPTGKNMLQQIEDRAHAGVETAAKKNAINLMAFALAGGALGAAVFRGPIGMLAAAGLAVWAGSQILIDPAGTQPPVQGLGSRCAY